jgi:hypothetical protein
MGGDHIGFNKKKTKHIGLGEPTCLVCMGLQGQSYKPNHFIFFQKGR